MKEYIKVKSTAKEKRETFIEHLAESYKNAGNDSAAAQVQALTKQEYRSAVSGAK